MCVECECVWSVSVCGVCACVECECVWSVHVWSVSVCGV